MELPVARLLILEDDSGRTEAMLRLLGAKLPQHSCHIFPTASHVISFYSQCKNEIVLIALDHDLEDLRDSEGRLVDPGTGRDVSNFLSRQQPTCPLIIHSTNRLAVDGMEFDLVEAGWAVQRIAPFGDLDWIEEAWIPAVLRALA